MQNRASGSTTAATRSGNRAQAPLLTSVTAPPPPTAAALQPVLQTPSPLQGILNPITKPVALNANSHDAQPLQALDDQDAWMSQLPNMNQNTMKFVKLQAQHPGTTPLSFFLGNGVSPDTIFEQFPNLTASETFWTIPANFSRPIQDIHSAELHYKEKFQREVGRNINMSAMLRNEKALKPLRFLEECENFVNFVHTRLFYRMPKTAIKYLFIQLSFMDADSRIPIQAYNMEHLPGILNQISSRGWQAAHDPASYDFRLEDFHPPELTGPKQKKAGKDEDYEDPDSPHIQQLHTLQLAVENHRVSRRRAAPSDCSLETIYRHILNKNWYLKLHAERMGLSPTQFCAKGYVCCVHKNAERFRLHQEPLDLAGVQSTFADITNSLAAGNSNTAPQQQVAAPSNQNSSNKPRQNKQGNKNNRNAMQAASRNNDEVQFCNNFNNRGCNRAQNVPGIACVHNGHVLQHLCSRYDGNNRRCMGKHRASQHDQQVGGQGNAAAGAAAAAPANTNNAANTGNNG